MNVRNALELGRALRAARERQGLTQQALAERHGTTQYWISQVENGKDAAQVGAVLRLARALGLELSLGASRINGDHDHSARGESLIDSVLDEHDDGHHGDSSAGKAE